MRLVVQDILHKENGHLVLVQWDGTHIYIRKRISFESESAQVWNNVVFQYIQKEAIEESLNMGKQRGEAPDMEGTGRRNAFTCNRT